MKRFAVKGLCAMLVLLLLLSGCKKAVPISNGSDIPTDPPATVRGDFAFNIVSAVRVSEKDTDRFAAYLIETKAALDTYGIEGTDTYTNAYFETKSLLLLCVTLESGSMELKIDRLARDGTALTVHYTTVEPYVQTADMAYRRLLLEVDRADVSGITSIVGERQRAAQAGTTVSP